MRFFGAILILVILFNTGYSFCQTSNSKLIFEKALVIERSETPKAGSGLIVSWIKIGIQTKEGVRHDLFLTYLGKDQQLPQIGLYYDFYCHMGRLHNIPSEKEDMILDEFIETKS